jgi:hypothetical protein
MILKELAKDKAKNGSVKEAFRNEEGAIDLASIMVGIIVIGLIGGVIAATVFAVIPWAQDNAAKQQLDAVNTAQSARAGLNDGKYSTNLTGLLDTPAAKVAIRSNEVNCFGAFVTSASGATFYSSSVKTQPTKVAANATWPATKPTGYPVGCSWPTTAVVAQNYIVNQSFEGSNVGVSESSGVSGVSGIGNGDKSFSVVDSSTAHSGTKVLRITRAGTTNGIGAGFVTGTVEPGDYVASFKIRSDKPLRFGSYSGETAPAGYVSAVKTVTDQTPVITLTPEWQTISAKFTVTQAGALKPGFHQTTAGGPTPAIGDIVEIDSVQVVKATGDDVRDTTYEQ